MSVLDLLNLSNIKVKATKKKTNAAWTVDWLPPANIRQEPNSGVEFSFISKDRKQCCPFVIDENFLNDAMMSLLHNRPIAIQGFKYSMQDNEPIDITSTRLAIANANDPNFSQNISTALTFISQIERRFRLIRSKKRPVKNPPESHPNVVIIESSSRWSVSPPMLSAYILLLRIGLVHEAGKPYKETIDKVANGEIAPYQVDDDKKIRESKEGLERIIKYGYPKIFYKNPAQNYPFINTSTMHYFMGIGPFANGLPKEVVKYWFRDLDKPRVSKKRKAASIS